MSNKSANPVLLVLFISFSISLALPAGQPKGRWQIIKTNGQPEKRHECSFIEWEDKFYLIGGRGRKPVCVYDPKTNSWTDKSRPPMQIHHFQPLVYDGKIYMAGTMTDNYPAEPPLPYIMIYDPKNDRWLEGPTIPEGRRRGSAGIVLYNDKIYMVGGIINGHIGDFVPWLDEYDPTTNTWKQLPDAPRPRDHFAAVVIGDKLYAAGGRRTSKKTNQVFQLTIKEVDVYDFKTGKWSTLKDGIPTERAGTSAVAYNGELLVIGGECGKQKQAHNEVEAYNPKTGKWRKFPPLARGRHGTGAFVYQNKIYTCAGSGNRGGGPELSSIEAYQP